MFGGCIGLQMATANLAWHSSAEPLRVPAQASVRLVDRLGWLTRGGVGAAGRLVRCGTDLRSAGPPARRDLARHHRAGAGVQGLGQALCELHLESGVLPATTVCLLRQPRPLP